MDYIDYSCILGAPNKLGVSEMNIL